MQRFINNWSTSLTAPATADAVSISVPPAEAAKLVDLGAGNYYLLTLFEVDAGTGAELRREIVRCTARAGGVLTVERGQEDSVGQVWDAGMLIEARLTKETMETLRDAAGGGAPLSDDDPAALGPVSPGASSEASRSDHVHPLPAPAEVGAATSAQGALADTAVQPADLATVATTGAYADLAGKPTIPSTAAEVGAIATTEKGAANGVATLGTDSKIPLAQLPATAITSTSVVANEAAMLALAAQEGDVAIRPDINTSFILAAEPAGTLSNWQEILAPSAGGGAPVGSSTPQPLGTATPGVSSSASRQDHVHDMPSAADVGADATGTAAAAVAAHAGTGGAAHAAVVAGGASGFMTGADKTKLDGIATGATQNSSDAFLLARGNHTGSQLASTISDFAATVRATVLAGLSLADTTVVTAADTALQAIGKLAGRLATAFNRANHTGEQAISTITGLDSALAARALIAGLPSRDVTASGAVTPSDAGKWLICNSATPITLTIGAEATAAWTTPGILPMFHILQIGAGAVTVTGDGFSVTLHAADTNVLDGAGAAATALWRAPNTWSLIGRLVAA